MRQNKPSIIVSSCLVLWFFGLSWATNPNAAKLFINFVLSKEGQEMVRSFNRIPARSDVEPISPKLEQTTLKLKAVPQDMGSRYNEYVQDFRRIFGL
jgi:ABC-type Fe3+ transport system substrate-binding protein